LFLGHFATAYAAKRLAPGTSLGTLFAAAQLPDVIWPVLVLTGVEQAAVAPGDTAFTPLRFDSYPISHSLLTVVAWGAAFGAVHFWRKHRPLDAFVLAALVVGHWVLDFVSHRPDIPLWPGGEARAFLEEPANVILVPLRGGAPDVAKVVDFGLVKDLDQDTDLSRDDQIAGTPLYLAARRQVLSALDTMSFVRRAAPEPRS